jgi:hypothetical protein
VPSIRDLPEGTPARKRAGRYRGGQKELPQLSLLDALELTLLIARKDPDRHQRVAARWLLRLLEEHPDVTIEEAGLAASCLIALTGARYQEAVQTLGAMAERATRRARARGVA